MSEQSCKTCVHWDVDSAKNKAGRIMSSWCVKCSYKVRCSIPSSSRKSLAEINNSIGYMSSKDGSDCPCYDKRGRS